MREGEQAATPKILAHQIHIQAARANEQPAEQQSEKIALKINPLHLRPKIRRKEKRTLHHGAKNRTNKQPRKRKREANVRTHAQ